MAGFEAWDGVAGWPAWGRAALVIPIYALGIIAGRRLFNLASPQFYRRVALVLVTAAGALALGG